MLPQPEAVADLFGLLPGGEHRDAEREDCRAAVGIAEGSNRQEVRSAGVRLGGDPPQGLAARGDRNDCASLETE